MVMHHGGRGPGHFSRWTAAAVPSLAFDFSTATLDSRITFTRLKGMSMKHLLILTALLATPALADEPTPLMGPIDNPAPAPRKPDTRWKAWEIAFQVANAADFATTEYCLRRDLCHEANPIVGRNPSTGKMLAIKVAGGTAHWMIVQHIARDDPKAARIFAMVSTMIIGGVAGYNARFMF